MTISNNSIDFLQQSLDTGRPIPGQSLTNSPEEPYNWEKPAEFSNPKEAMLYVFETLTVPETTANTLISLTKGIGVIDIASITLYAGFLEGKWNPDLMVLLMEPTMYMIMALAEKAGIDYDMEAGDNEVAVEMSSDSQIEEIQGTINELDKMRKISANRVSPQSVPTDIRETIEETDLAPSLLERVEKETHTSLLGKGN